VNGPITKRLECILAGVYWDRAHHRANLTIGRTMTLSARMWEECAGSARRSTSQYWRVGICFAEDEDGIHGAVTCRESFDKGQVCYSFGEGGHFDAVSGGRNLGLLNDLRRLLRG